MAVENKNDKNGVALVGKETSKCLKEHSSGSTWARQADRNRVRCSQPRSTNSCAVPSRGAWGSNGGSLQEEPWHTCTGVCVCVVPRISAGVQLSFSISATTTCTLRPFPGERKAAHDCHCWFCSCHTTNPLLIPLGGAGDVTITGAAQC